MKCLVVSFDYPPSQSVAVNRVGAIVAALQERGHAVRVVAGAGFGSAGARPEASYVDWFDVWRLRMRRDLPELPPSGVGHAPRPRGPARFQRFIAEQAAPGSPLKKAVYGVGAPLIEWPDAMAGWVRPAAREATAISHDMPCDVLFASGPPYATYLVAERVVRQTGIPWVADYRDLWTSSSYYQKPGWRRAIDRRTERRALATATLATTVSEPLADDLRSDFGIRAETVLNGYSPVEAAPLELRPALSPARLNLLYVGDNLYGGKRTPAPLFRAAASLRLGPDDVRFHFLGTNPPTIERIARSAGVADLIEIHPRVDREQSIALQSRADQLLLLMWNDPGEAGVYTGKLFEYIAVRRPVVLVGYPHGVAAELIRSRSLGHVISNDQQAVTVLRDLLAQKTSAALLPDLDPRLRAGLAQHEQALRMVSLLEETASRSPRR